MKIPRICHFGEALFLFTMCQPLNLPPLGTPLAKFAKFSCTQTFHVIQYLIYSHLSIPLKTKVIIYQSCQSCQELLHAKVNGPSLCENKLSGVHIPWVHDVSGSSLFKWRENAYAEEQEFVWRRRTTNMYKTPGGA